jgi:hypothetical protein
MIQGKGELWAAGKGFVHLVGKGVLTLESYGDGLLVIHNVSKTKIKIIGKGKVMHVPKKDALVIVDLKGKVELTGSKLAMTFKGGKVALHASGKGNLWLTGEGVFKIGHYPPFKWPPKIKKFTY